MVEANEWLSEGPSTFNIFVVLAVCCTALAVNSLVGWLLMLRQTPTWHNVFKARMIGAIVLIVPAFIFNASFLPSTAFPWDVLIVTVLLVTAAILFQRFRRRNEVDVRVYGYLYTASHHINFVLAEFFGWALYLYSYELLIRGVLFQATINSIFDLFTAFFISNVIYALAHIHQGKRELVASFFAGWVFCAIAWWTGSFIVPYIIHLALGLANSYFMSRTRAAGTDTSNSNSFSHVR